MKFIQACQTFIGECSWARLVPSLFTALPSTLGMRLGQEWVNKTNHHGILDMTDIKTKTVLNHRNRTIKVVLSNVCYRLTSTHGLLNLNRHLRLRLLDQRILDPHCACGV